MDNKKKHKNYSPSAGIQAKAKRGGQATYQTWLKKERKFKTLARKYIGKFYCDVCDKKTAHILLGASKECSKCYVKNQQDE